VKDQQQLNVNGSREKRKWEVRPLANALSLDCADKDYLSAGAGQIKT